MTPEEKAQRIINDCPFTEAFYVLEGGISHALDQARAEALEEAARVADDMEPDKCCGNIAAAIRALKE